MTNAALDAIMTRSSTRGFQPEPLAEEEVQTILNAALASPSGMNQQPWRFIAVTNRELILKIERDTVQRFIDMGDDAVNARMKARNNKVIYDAPLYVVVVIDPTAGNYVRVDAGIAAQSMAIAAKSIGLDSVILGLPSAAISGPNAAEYKKELGIPDGFEFAISIAIGRAAVQKGPHTLDPAKIIRIR